MLPYYRSSTEIYNELVPSPRFPGSYASFKWCYGGASVDEKLTEATDEAVRQVYKSLTRLQSAKLSTSLAEARESAGLIAKSATRLFNCGRHLKSGKFNKLFKELGFTKKTKLPKHLVKKYRVKTLKAYKRKRARQLLGNTKNYDGSITDGAAEMWLEIQFGWLPIMQDIDGVMKGLVDMLFRRPPMFRIVGDRKSVV